MPPMELPKYAQPEIERRWHVPNAEAALRASLRCRQLDDKYLDGGRLRLRQVREEGQPTLYKLGKKYAREPGQADAVVTVYLTHGEYQALSSLPGRTVQKLRYTVAGGSLDMYVHPHAGLAVFEREFEDARSAAAHTPPAFVGEEITGQAAWSGFALADPLPARCHPQKPVTIQ